MGTFLLGFFDSAAATPTISVPWKAKPAIMTTPTMAWKPPTKGASPLVKLLKPGDSTPCIKPKIVARPMMMNTTTVMTLISANQNSLSPKLRTETTLSRNIKPRNSALQ
ncbi:hypothetical protein D3C86_1983700 [compost metagenome]